MKKTYKAALIGLGVVAGVALAQVGYASAATTTNNDEFPRGVQSIVEKFNLNKDEVVKVLEEDRAAHQAEMKAEFEKKLAALVTDGKITEAQKEAIMAKHDAFTEAGGPDNREARRAERQEFRTWLSEQGIDESLVMPEGRGNGGQGRGMHRSQNSN